MGESIMDGVPYLYGESLKGKRVTLPIKAVKSGAEFISGDGRKTAGFDIAFAETPKLLGVTGVTVRRQLVVACGGDDFSQWPGRRITLFPVKSTKSATGVAIRVAPADQTAGKENT